MRFIDGDPAAIFADPVLYGVMLGLLIGKPIGIMLMSFLTVKLKAATLPQGVTWLHMLGAGILGGGTDFIHHPIRHFHRHLRRSRAHRDGQDGHPAGVARGGRDRVPVPARAGEAIPGREKVEGAFAPCAGMLRFGPRSATRVCRRSGAHRTIGRMRALYFPRNAKNVRAPRRALHDEGRTA